jgi:Fur family ferric uptake transcriptional regulator
LRRQIEAHFGFQILLARTEVGGYCAHCQVLRAREMQAAAQPEGAAKDARANTRRRK